MYLKPDPVDPDWKTLSAAVDLIFWIHGTDSAGNIIRGGGPTGEGSVVPIQSSDDEHTSEYRLEYEEALFKIEEDAYVRWSPDNSHSWRISYNHCRSRKLWFNRRSFDNES